MCTRPVPDYPMVGEISITSRRRGGYSPFQGMDKGGGEEGTWKWKWILGGCLALPFIIPWTSRQKRAS